MKKSRKKVFLYSIMAMLFAAGLAVAAFFDLEISAALSGFSDSDGVLSLDVQPLAALLEILGEWPAVLISCAALFIVTSVSAETHRHGALIRIFFVFPAAALLFYGFVKTAEHITGENTLPSSSWIFLPASLLLACVAAIATKKIPQSARKRLFFPAAYTLIAAVAILLSVSSLKVIWGRIRLRELVAAGSLDGFTPWYQPNFFSGSHSFPSGHTAHNTLTLMLPAWLYGKGIKHRTALYSVCAVFIALMGISRLAAGAHYLSDVLFGFAIAFAVTELSRYFYARRHGSGKAEIS